MASMMQKERKSIQKKSVEKIEEPLSDPCEVDREVFDALLKEVKAHNGDSSLEISSENRNGITEQTEVDTVAKSPSLECQLEVEEGVASAPMEEEQNAIEFFESPEAHTYEEITDQLRHIAVSQEITPFKEAQLYSYYPIPKLDEIEAAVETFLQDETKIASCPFYQLVLNYFIARGGLQDANKTIEDCKHDCSQLIKEVWDFQAETTSKSDKCQDGQRVSYHESHDIAVYNKETAIELTKKLKRLREISYESHSLNSYKVEMLRLEIDFYLAKVMTSTSNFENLPKYSPPVCLESNSHEPYHNQIVQMKECISVLFSFLRRNIEDETFLQHVKDWVSNLASLLLRFASYKDHYFLVNQLLRLPAGSADWTHVFLQVLPPISLEEVIGSPELDHVIAIISLILSPIKDRQKFLHHLKPTEDSEDFIILEDSDGTERDIMSTWSDLHENDIVQFLNQIPFNDLFKHILLMKGDSNCYDVSKTTPSGFLTLFSFCTRLLNVMSQGIHTYEKAHVEGVAKRLARFIRHMLLYVTDHWEEFKSYQQKQNQREDDSMMARLLVEYNEFFERTVKVLYISPRCAGWQFLADLPFHSLSFTKMAKIAYDLHVGYKVDSFYDIDLSWADMLATNDTKERFVDHVKNINETDSYYLLTSLSNIASCCSIADKVLTETIVSNIFEVCFVLSTTSDKLHRTGRDLLAAIVTRHPFVVSVILWIIQKQIHEIGSLSMYLFKFLDLTHWKTTETDIRCLEYWITEMPAASLESQFGRCVLEKLNWGFINGHLALPESMHQSLALTLIKAYAKKSPLASRNLITESVKTVTSAIYSISMDELFLEWCWSMFRHLKLHKMDQSPTMVQRVLADPGLILDGIRDMTTAKDFDEVRKGILHKDPFYVFISLLMTSWGHSIPEICKEGLSALKILAEGVRLDAAISVLSMITPLFFRQHHELSSDPTFILIVSTILSSDQSYLNLAKSFVTSDKLDECQKLFAGMIVTQIRDYKKYNANEPHIVTSFWIQVLTSIPHWKSNDAVLRLLDVMCEISVCDEQWKSHITNILIDQIRPGEQLRMLNALSSLLNWVVAIQVDESKSLLVRYSNPDVPWFSLTALIAEAQIEISSGLWKHLLRTLHDNQSYSIDSALKATCDHFGIPQVQSNSLCIYRLGQQVLDLPSTHPAFPATLQAFLTLHLSRVVVKSTGAESFCVTPRFYEGYINRQFLNKIQTKVSEAYAFTDGEVARLEVSLAEELTYDEHNRLGFFKTQREFLKAATLWLEDKRLYDSDLYLPALPPHFMTSKLEKIFDFNFEMWIENMDVYLIEKSQKIHIKVWEKYRSVNTKVIGSPIRQQASNITITKCPPSLRILQRLRQYDDPKGPPPVPNKRLITRNKEDFDIKTVLFRVDHFTGIALERSSCKLMWSRELCATDCTYMELLPKLWSNAIKKSKVYVECRPGRFSKMKECTGPARMKLEYEEKVLDNVTKNNIDYNRNHHRTLLNEMLQSPQLAFCEASIQLQAIVEDVCKWHSKNIEDKRLKDIETGLIYGRKLFYHLVDLVTDDNSTYAPFKQLISSCVEALGQNFIQDQESCQEELARHVLETNHTKGSLLSPHFSPIACGTSLYLELYKSLVPHASREPEKVFMLMSKFELEAVIHNQSLNVTQQKNLLKTIFQALSTLLSTEDPSTSIALELYRIHLQTIVMHNFQAHYQDFLNFLLEMSSDIIEDPCDIASSLWYDFLNIMSKGVIVFRPEMPLELISDNVNILANSSPKLSPQEILDLTHFLRDYFLKVRLSNGLQGLYSVYKPYTKPMSILLGILTCQHIYSVHDNCIEQEIATPDAKIWNFMECLWLPWIAPLGEESKEYLPKWVKQLSRYDTTLLPWRPWDLHEQAFTMSIFMICVKFLHNEIKHSCALQRLLDYYARIFAKGSIKEHVLSVIHAQFSAMPWVSMRVSPRDVEIMSKIMNDYLPESHSFIGHIFLEFQWDDILSRSLRSLENKPDDEERLSNVTKLHTNVLNILIRISFEPSVRSNGCLMSLLNEAPNFAWEFVDSEAYENILNWFVMSADPRIIINSENITRTDTAALKLMHVAAGYVPGSTNHPDYTHMKRLLLVRCLARFFKIVSDRFKQCVITQPDLIFNAFFGMLRHMEDTVMSAIPSHRQIEEGQELAKELMVVVGNSSSSPPLQDACRDATLTWLKGHHMSFDFLISFTGCVCQGILQLHLRTPILEAILQSCIDYCEERKIEIPWDRINKALYFPPTSPMPLLTYCGQENHLLVFYAYVKWRVDVKGVTSGDEGMLLSNFVEALVYVQSDTTSDVGLILVVGEILKLLRIEVLKTGDKELAWAHCSKLIEVLRTLGDDSGTKGILAAIGLGRKPTLNLKTRLFAKCLAVFLQYQIVEPGVFRFVDNEIDISEEQKRELLFELQALLKDNTYAGLKPAIDLVGEECDTSPYSSMRHAVEFYANLVSVLFSDLSVFQHIVKS